MKTSKDGNGNVDEKSNPQTEPTNDPLGKIGIGDNVWVKQGRTEHVATLVGKPRKVVGGNGVKASTEEEYEAMIRWTTTGTTCYVKTSSIRPMMDGQRRRRQVVKHYTAGPSQRLTIPKKRQKKSEAPKDKPIIQDRKEENEEVKTETATAKAKGLSFGRQLPTAEEFQRYQENLKRLKEKKARKKLIRKRMRGTTNGDSSTVMNDAETPENDSKQAPVGTIRRRISESEGDDKIKETTNVLRAFRKSNDDVEDRSLTIDRGYQWEWEKPESKDKPTESLSEQKKSVKLLPQNFGEGKPRGWTEAYMMILEFQRNNSEGEEMKCEIPLNHPLLGNFIADIRAEYEEFRKRIRKQQEDNPRQNADQHFQGHHSQDLMRVTPTRIRQLRKIGFRWRPDSKSPDQSLNSEERASIDSDSSEEHFDITSFEDSFASSRSDRSIVSHREDHNNDDKLLIVSRLSEIELRTNLNTNMSLIRDKKPTFPVQLYRLLRLSTLNPKLGLNKIIRWNDEGDGFWMLDDDKFMKQILLKISKMTNVSFRNALKTYGFFRVELRQGRNTGDFQRFYKHRSILEAQKSDKFRLFYRGAPIEVLWKIQNKKDKKLLAENRRRNEQIKAEESQPLDHTHSTSREQEIHSKDNKKRRKKEGMTCGYGEPLCKRQKKRRTVDGCLIPKKVPDRHKDGTYKRPSGKKPYDMSWDAIRGIWSPITLDSKEKVSLAESSVSNEDSFSSSSGGDATIIKASKEKVLQHSLRLLLDLKKRKRRYGRNVHQTPILQARTKSNPSGIVTNSINLRNWQNIENLKRRSAKRQNTGNPYSPATTSTAFSNEEALV